MESINVAVDKTMSMAARGGTLSIGLAVVGTQVGLIAATGATNLFLASLIYGKNAGVTALQNVHAAEQAVEARLREALAFSVAMAKIPADKMAEYTNTFLDVANAAVDKMLGSADEKEAIDSSVTDRFRFLSRRVTGGLSKRAHEEVIDPVKTQVHDIIEKLNQKILLADYIQKQREWASERVETLSDGAIELKKKMEDKARELNISPEEMLVKSIRRTSQKLNENFSQLRAHGDELVGSNVATKIDAATSYVQQLDSNLEKAQDIYQIRDEVLVEARHKFDEMAQWTASLWVGENSQNAPQQNSTVQ